MAPDERGRRCADDQSAGPPDCYQRRTALRGQLPELPSEKGARARGSVALRNPICEWRGVELGRLVARGAWHTFSKDRVPATTRLACEGDIDSGFLNGLEDHAGTSNRGVVGQMKARFRATRTPKKNRGAWHGSKNNVMRGHQRCT